MNVIDDLQLKLDIKDDMITGLNLTIDALTEENRRLRDSQKNTVKMLKSVMQMLDRVALK